MVPRVREGEGGDEVKRYNCCCRFDDDGCPEGYMCDVPAGQYVLFADVDAALSARDARIAELERHLAACKAECGAWRDAKDRGRLLWSRIPGGLISDSFTLASLQKIDELRAATDANGGVR